MFEHHRPHPHVHVLRYRGSRAIRRMVAGTAMILFGAGWLLRNQGLVSTEDLWLIGPSVIFVGGLLRLGYSRGAADMVRGVMALVLAAYFFVVIKHIGGLTFATTWPVLLIALGLASIARAVFARRGGACEEPNW